MAPKRTHSPEVFISYRQLDSIGHASHLRADLKRHFGADRIFMDIYAIEAGEKFDERITTALDSANVVVAVIGKDWITAAVGNMRRLDNPKDYVRLEIAMALSRGISLIPVLIDGATMPDENDLPEDIQELARYQAFEVSDRRWEYDVGQLIQTIEKALHPQQRRMKQILIISVAITGLLIGAINFWLTRQRQAALIDNTAPSTPSPLGATASSSPSITEPGTGRTPTSQSTSGGVPTGHNSPTPNASVSISPEREEVPVPPPWHLIESAVRAEIPGYVEDVRIESEPECKKRICDQRVIAVQMGSGRNPFNQAVMVTYEPQKDGKWKITAKRIN